MPSKRAILEQLARDELQAIVERFSLSVTDRRVRDLLIEAVAASRRATLAEVLPELPRDRLKAICRALDLDDSGKEKSVLVSRLVGVSATDSSLAREEDLSNGPINGRTTESNRPPSDPPSTRGQSKRNGASTPKKNGGDLGFEATLWQAADKLRNNLDAAEYKHVVLGLIFLKYISDAFQERYRELEREVEDGADPEDPDEYSAKNIFWVPQDARWEKIQANAKKPSNGQVIDDAMTAIERENTSLKGVLPKNYSRPQLDKGNSRASARRP
jgi:type I restriction enzyme M protein